MAGRQRGILLAAGIAAVAVLAAGAVWLRLPRLGSPEVVAEPAVAAGTRPAKPREPRLYCEFYNFAGRAVKVAFYFGIADEAASPRYGQIFQREIDGTQTDFGADGQPRPAWAFDRSDEPATLRSPDEAIQINLYGYKPVAGTTWFEAGLRSVQYLNLDGKCRRSAA